MVATARAALGGRSRNSFGASDCRRRTQRAAAADAALFRGRRLVLTPLDENRNQDFETVAALWTAIGRGSRA